jgi:peptidoglycan biosynthesis protein MviN/MurJ (putative lipid II flippase)
MSALIKSTAAVGSMTLLSRVLGLARDIVIARFFSWCRLPCAKQPDHHRK